MLSVLVSTINVVSRNIFCHDDTHTDTDLQTETLLADAVAAGDAQALTAEKVRT